MSGEIHIVGGPNGAGKTTFAREYLTKEASCPTFINADLIAAGLSPFAPNRVALHAGRIMLELIDGAAARGESFAFETTLAGRNYVAKIHRWRALGYDVILHFLSLPSAEFAIARVEQRVAQGGHGVPEDVIRRRFVSGGRNFEGVYKHVVNTWTLYDGTTATPVVLEHGGNP